MNPEHQPTSRDKFHARWAVIAAIVGAAVGSGLTHLISRDVTDAKLLDLKEELVREHNRADRLELQLKELQKLGRHSKINLEGEWRLEHKVTSTSYNPYVGMTLGYRVFFRQNGDQVIGTGEKYLENGHTIPSSAHTPIEFNGTIRGAEVRGTFLEHGRRRSPSGTFLWRLLSDSRSFTGTFTSTAASTSGDAIGVKTP